MPRPSDLRRLFGERLQEGVSLARFTSSRTGGKADFLIDVRCADELRETASGLWGLGETFRVLGGGSNVLVADEGGREGGILNRARRARFDQAGMTPRVRAESGAALGGVARRAAARGFSGLEWAATVPGGGGGAGGGDARGPGGGGAGGAGTA